MIKRTQDATGRAMFQDAGASIPWALWKAFSAWIEWVYRAKSFAVYEYRKARKGSIPYHVKIPIDDPILSREDDKSSDRPQDFLPQDEAALTVYKTEGGKYFTESMLKDHKFAETLAHSRITMAAEISDERAEKLCNDLDQLEMDVELTENEKLLRSILRQHLAAQWV